MLRFLMCAVLGALSFEAEAQQAAKIPRIGYISGASNMGASEVGFQKGLRELGYTEGKNILVEYRYQEGNAERGPILVAELIKLGVDLLVVIPSRAIRAAKQATKTIPIVIATTADPVGSGLIDSLARPGGNITGVTRLTRDLNGKRLELLKEVVLTKPRIGVLYQIDSTSGDDHFKDYETAARGLKIELHDLAISGQNPEIEKVFQSALKARVRGLLTVSNSLMQVNRKKIVNLATKHQLPSMFESSHWPEAGGLMSYSADEEEQYRRAAVYVDKILKGAKPAELPIEQPTKFELVINLKTAKEIRLTIPPNVLTRADKVIK